MPQKPSVNRRSPLVKGKQHQPAGRKVGTGRKLSPNVVTLLMQQFLDGGHWDLDLLRHYLEETQGVAITPEGLENDLDRMGLKLGSKVAARRFADDRIRKWREDLPVKAFTTRRPPKALRGLWVRDPRSIPAVLLKTHIEWNKEKPDVDILKLNDPQPLDQAKWRAVDKRFDATSSTLYRMYRATLNGVPVWHVSRLADDFDALSGAIVSFWGMCNRPTLKVLKNRLHAFDPALHEFVERIQGAELLPALKDTAPRPSEGSLEDLWNQSFHNKI